MKSKSVIFICLIIISLSAKAQSISLGDQWKFKTGDSLQWARPEYNDNNWKTISTGYNWENTGYPDYDGYAWYRIKKVISSTLRSDSYLKDSLKIKLGMIDDADQVYLNGILIGQNAGLKSDKFEELMPWDAERKYVISAENPAIQWDKENVIAVRVYDQGGPGGMYSGKQSISMTDVSDYIKINTADAIINTKNDKSGSCTIRISNSSQNVTFSGTLYEKAGIHGNRNESSETEISLKPGTSVDFTSKYTDAENLVVNYTFRKKKSGIAISASLGIPYILTPKPSKMPRINGAKVFGVRPGNPFLFKVAATGEQPLTYAAENLPAGLVLDVSTGIITGKVFEKGEYIITLSAANKFGRSERKLKIICGETLCLTPPMGWNSWNCWGLSVSDSKVKQSADALVKSGLIDHGWTYINIDDGWELNHQNGKIITNDKFPDMKGLCDYIHSYGLKMGIYSSPGPKTCGGYEGSYSFEEADARSYAGWGIDYLKYDWCSYTKIAPSFFRLSKDALKKPYFVMQKALLNCKRDIVFSLCQYGMGDVWEWGEEVGGNLWRTTGDITDTWKSLSAIGFSQYKCSPYARPGHWNDPDMLVIGKVGWGPSLHNTRLTFNEQYTHISLWALLSAPMLIGCDLNQLDAFTLNLLTNDEVIDIDQDPLGKQAVRIIENKNYQVWIKELEDGSKAIGIFNISDEAMKIEVSLKDINLNGHFLIRDVWRQKNIGTWIQNFESHIASHGVTLVKITKIE